MNLSFKPKKGRDPKYGNYVITTESSDGNIIQRIEFSSLPNKKFLLHKTDEGFTYFNIPYPYPKKSALESFNHDFSKMIQAIKDGYADTILMTSGSILGIYEYPIYFMDRTKGMAMREEAEREFVNSKLCYAIRVARGFGSTYLFDDGDGERLEFESMDQAEKYIHDKIISYSFFDNDATPEIKEKLYNSFREKYTIVHSICTRK